MNLLLLHVADCPHVGELTSRIDVVALHGRRADLVLRQVHDVHEAIRLDMRGSPTLLIDGLDPFVSDAEPTLSRAGSERDGGLDEIPPCIIRLQLVECLANIRHEAGAWGIARS